ncbi:general transcription factor IIF subunit 1 [Cherax quadricarinatus]|uniref:general transcription factor IIF subunit 1 n=1 Tax=Cherax quadricarinatus TaxID=27406 RepID=UPI00387E8953
MASSSQGSVTEYVVRVPKAQKKRYNMMRFHAALGVDFKTWTHTKMERENNMKEFKSLEEEMPKFGAGSEFGREQREEARRKKYGINVKKYRPEDQPWILSVGGKNGKKFRGIREGGVSENSSWYVFMQGKDGAFEAYPVEEWYNFKPMHRYKSLSAEEAEKEFERRDKIMNYFSVMYQKKLKKDGEEAADGDEESMKKKGPSAKSMILSELDDWMSDNESEGEEDDEESDGDRPKKKKKVQAKGRSQHGGKKKKNFDGESDEDCFEESDEHDDGAEHDYISSDSSDSDAENDEIVRTELTGVENQDGLRKLLGSDEEEEEEKEKDKEKEDEEKKETEEKEEKDKKKKKKKKKKDKKADASKEDSDARSSENSDEESGSKKKKRGKDSESKNKGKSEDGGSSKRKLKANPSESLAKKQCTDVGAAGASSLVVSPGSDSGVTEEAIRRYLMRKPMTTTELLQKFKCKKTGLSSDQLVHAIAQILKRISLTKQMVKGKMYLSIKQ